MKANVWKLSSDCWLSETSRRFTSLLCFPCSLLPFAFAWCILPLACLPGHSYYLQSEGYHLDWTLSHLLVKSLKIYTKSIPVPVTTALKQNYPIMKQLRNPNRTHAANDQRLYMYVSMLVYVLSMQHRGQVVIIVSSMGVIWRKHVSQLQKQNLTKCLAATDLDSI